MKANELRIGNLVYWNGEIGIISQLLEMEVAFKCGESDLYEALDPIQLTEEWLLKFGFEMINSSPINYKIYRLKDISFNVIKDSNIKLYNKIVYSEQYRHIESIHQLQNLYFALTGDELTIKNK
jgi:phage FluMu gp28-like protein